MRREDVLICYDIRNKKRLNKIGKIIEADAIRIQRSVYFYEQINKKELNALIDKVLKIFDEKVDDLRVYTIKNRGIALGKAIDLNNPLILI